jgi:hypothetical protein
LASHGGKRPGAGRKNGSKARKTICIQNKLEELGFDPIRGLVEVATTAKAEGDLRLYGDMCKELAHYIAPKLKAVELSGDKDAPLAITQVERTIVDTETKGS